MTFDDFSPAKPGVLPAARRARRSSRTPHPLQPRPPLGAFSGGRPVRPTIRKCRLDPLSAPDVVQTSVRRFAGDVADPGRRAALEASAIVRVTREPVLAALLAKEDVRAEFEWLCRFLYGFAPTGVYPHDLVREALSRDLLWRNPHRYEELQAAGPRVLRCRSSGTPTGTCRRRLWPITFSCTGVTKRSAFFRVSPSAENGAGLGGRLPQDAGAGAALRRGGVGPACWPIGSSTSRKGPG